MTRPDHHLGPFVIGTHDGHPIGWTDVENRIHAVRDFNREQCEQALAMEYLQKTVRRAVKSRIRFLDRVQS